MNRTVKRSLVYIGLGLFALGAWALVIGCGIAIAVLIGGAVGEQ